MPLSQSLSPVFQRHDEIVPIQTKAAPVFNDTQPFSCSIQVGIDQPRHSQVGVCFDNHRLHGSLRRIACSPAAMDNSGSESTMHVLVWGIILLGGIGVFIVWGLSNAYPAVG
jgi:hypothetical protein